MVIASQKVAGDNVSIDEHQGMGTLVNVTRERRPTTGPISTAHTLAPCCVGDNCNPIITFSGVVFDCACACLGNFVGSDCKRSGDFSIQLGVATADSFNSTPFTMSLDVSECSCSYLSPGNLLTFRAYGGADVGCSEEFPDELSFRIFVQVAFISDVWYIWSELADDQRGVIFYGTTTDVGTPATNEIACQSEFNSYDNPITECFSGGARDVVGVAHSGTATISFA